MTRNMLLCVAVLLVSACGKDDPAAPDCRRMFEAQSLLCTDPEATARLRVVQGTATGHVDVYIGNEAALSTVAIGEVSPFASVRPGTYAVRVKRSGAEEVLGERTVTLSSNDTTTLILIDSSTVINPIVLTDTGSAPVAGKSRLRVVHFATHAPEIDVWRTQPDYQTLIRVMFPFAYRAASPYLLSDPGEWTVVVTPKDQTTQLYSTGAIDIPAGKVRTVVLLDAPTGGITAVILDY